MTLAAVDVAREAAAPAADAPCSNRSMSPARGAHSSKPAAAAAQNATDRRTDRRTPDSIQTVRALSKITKMFSYFFPINSDFCPCLIMLLLMCSTEKKRFRNMERIKKPTSYATETICYTRDNKFAAKVILYNYRLLFIN